MRTFTKHPGAKKDYLWDWSTWLAKENDTIVSFEFETPEGITLEDPVESDGGVIAWVSGGILKQSYPVTCTITTNFGRIDPRTAIFNIEIT